MKNISTLMIIYSGVFIAAGPLARAILQEAHVAVVVVFLFMLFVILFFVSVSFAVFMVFPETDTLLPNPAEYYHAGKIELHGSVSSIQIPLTEEIDSLLLEKYITELAYITIGMEGVVKRKSKFYMYAFASAIASSVLCMFSLILKYL
ncbi:hypothetical protein [Chitinophaga sp. Cy-1792]|uniref:hypothetical protein n=1 Tax=Chitinophaga sp. Cy-1792 TaxID=2608339 RepID=UPI0014210856|nr:hypothetical protein [Chitinophaga sp. Cy-1792]NIG54652.1 hypothetical protein [Chitinophaga sp. Cy-1792]